jgi:dephospho-CoA kinase
MLKIGVTGGIGSGKSTVCEIFKHLGTPVFNSDYEANKLLNTSEVIGFYKNEFGSEVFSNVSLDKQKIAAIIFNNAEALKKVNNFIHPLVNSQFAQWVLKQKNCFYVIKESALLLEQNSLKDLDYIILIMAPLELRIKRVVLRDNSEETVVMKRIENQATDAEKMKRANYIITNDEHSLLLPQVLNLHRMFITEAQNNPLF